MGKLSAKVLDKLFKVSKKAWSLEVTYLTNDMKKYLPGLGCAILPLLYAGDVSSLVEEQLLDGEWTVRSHKLNSLHSRSLQDYLHLWQGA